MAIAGGGPAGLAVAIETSRRGLKTVVLDRRSLPVDKACGEGLMPPAVRALEELGALNLVARADAAPFIGVRFIESSGRNAEARFRIGRGLGVRRLALARALKVRALESGVEIHDECAVRGFTHRACGLEVITEHGRLRTRMLVAADGLQSKLREVAGLALESRGPHRFGMRQHYRIRPWSEFVEVYLGRDAEAYVTPVGAERVGIAFLWEDGRPKCEHSMPGFLAQFPTLAARLNDAEADSEVRGAGPLARAARARVAERFALVGDAAGYVDAITGEGLSLALVGGQTLGRLLPDALSRGATRESLRAYERESTRQYRRYAFVTRSMLAMARRSRMRELVVGLLSRYPRAFDALLNWAIAGA
ncbi:MAG: NAD(P)/FAD-dependent oxidoreductase [Candidatus Binataceae bacterium]